ncbi:hypothetical protein BH23CHL7_BH23CHL7_01320 [soil metagenome]
MYRLIGISLTTLLAIGLLLVAAVLPVAAQDEECALTVEPATAPAGAQFVLGGTGYTPEQLILERGSAQPVAFDLNLGDADPFEIPIGSKTGDEGLWQAVVVDTDTGCHAGVEFRVTLQPTDMLDDLLATGAGELPISLYLLVIVGGFGAGTLIARYARAHA